MPFHFHQICLYKEHARPILAIISTDLTDIFFLTNKELPCANSHEITRYFNCRIEERVSQYSKDIGGSCEYEVGLDRDELKRLSEQMQHSKAE